MGVVRALPVTLPLQAPPSGAGSTTPRASHHHTSALTRGQRTTGAEPIGPGIKAGGQQDGSLTALVNVGKHNYV